MAVRPLNLASRKPSSSTSEVNYTKASAGHLKNVFVRASEAADVLAICGDMTDYGLPEEAAILAQDIKPT